MPCALLLERTEEKETSWIKSSVFLNMTSCSPLEVNRRFGSTSSLHLQGPGQRALFVTCVQDGFLIGIFFDPEDGGDMFLYNDGWLSTDYMRDISQKTELFITTGVRTSNPTGCIKTCWCCLTPVPGRGVLLSHLGSDGSALSARA
jgi:hypothetical protein